MSNQEGLDAILGNTPVMKQVTEKTDQNVKDIEKLMELARQVKAGTPGAKEAFEKMHNATLSNMPDTIKAKEEVLSQIYDRLKDGYAKVFDEAQLLKLKNDEEKAIVTDAQQELKDAQAEFDSAQSELNNANNYNMSLGEKAAGVFKKVNAKQEKVAKATTRFGLAEQRLAVAKESESTALHRSNIAFQSRVQSADLKTQTKMIIQAGLSIVDILGKDVVKINKQIKILTDKNKENLQDKLDATTAMAESEEAKVDLVAKIEQVTAKKEATVDKNSPAFVKLEMELDDLQLALRAAKQRHDDNFSILQSAEKFAIQIAALIESKAIAARSASSLKKMMNHELQNRMKAIDGWSVLQITSQNIKVSSDNQKVGSKIDNMISETGMQTAAATAKDKTERNERHPEEMRRALENVNGFTDVLKGLMLRDEAVKKSIQDGSYLDGDSSVDLDKETDPADYTPPSDDSSGSSEKKGADKY